MPETITLRSIAQVTQAGDTQNSSLPSAQWLSALRTWTERYRQRRALFNLAEADRHLLEDIGVSRWDALRESAKPFWRR
jgi:uncharacterized protein YjiS (DUF1127 family)